MKILVKSLFLIFMCVGVISCQEKSVGEIKRADNLMEVAVYKGDGGDEECIIDAVESLKIDKDIDVSLVTADDILNGKLNELDAIVIPGGSGSKQFSNLGDMGVEKVRNAVKEFGLGIVGLCAGSYIMSDTPDYVCFKMSHFKAIDVEHDERGHGTIAFKLTKEGEKIFPELENLGHSFIHYYEGPVLVPIENKTENSAVVATMLSDVHLQNDAPEGMTPGKPFFINGNCGKGKYFMSIGHPENTPGMRWMLPRMIRWTLGKSLKSYSKSVVRPTIYNSEILFDKALLDVENFCFKQLIYGTEQEKIDSIEKLVLMKSWSARDKLPGLLRDNSKNVRVAAANALLELERTEAIPQLGTIIKLENDQVTKSRLQNILDEMKMIVGQ